MIFILTIFIAIFLKIFASEDVDGFCLINVEDASSLSEEFTQSFEQFVVENPKLQSIQTPFQLMHYCSTCPLNLSDSKTVSTFIKAIGEPYVTHQEQQTIAMYFLNRKRDANDYYLTQEQRRKIASVIMRYFLDASIPTSQKLLEALMLFNSEAFYKPEGEYIFRLDEHAFVLNCRPQLVKMRDFDHLAETIMNYIFKEPDNEFERYARYKYCEMWHYTGIHFDEPQ